MLLAVGLLKRMVFDKFKSLTDIERLIDHGKLRKILLGNLIIIGFYKRQAWYSNYFVGSMYPKEPLEVYKYAAKHKVKEITGLLPNEVQIA